jgi:hypothetical protein
MLLMNNFLNPYRKKINKYYPFRFCSIIKLRYLANYSKYLWYNYIEVTDSSKQENVKNSNRVCALVYGFETEPNSTISTEGINTKKQIILGMAPNRLLIKAFKESC